VFRGIIFVVVVKWQPQQEASGMRQGNLKENGEINYEFCIQQYSYISFQQLAKGMF
jgi:hypothetical protein